ncbi:MAG: MFS transporter [Phycisphaerales bacterium]|nr:MFS transporter [Phycisphaerales bacterium]
MPRALRQPISAAIGAIAPGAQRPLIRRNYRFELANAGLMPAALACVDGGVAGLIAAKAFNAGPIVVATLTGASSIANVTSVAWTRWVHGADRVRFVNGLQWSIIACVLVAAAAPFSTPGLWVLTLSVLAAQAFITGISVARADIWRANYPRTERGRITGKIAIATALVAGLAGLLAGKAIDWDKAAGGEGHGYRWVFLACAALAVGGVWSMSRVRWRGRVSQLKRERAHRDADHHAASARAMLDLLRKDHAYRRFMWAQFVLGVPSLAALPIFVIALTDQFKDLSYAQSITLTHVLPMVMPVAAIPFWARLLDRMHIVRFRTYHSWSFVAANFLMGAGFLLGSETVLYVSRIVLGIAAGGGTLAWNLGHHDFAQRDRAAVYMGLHVTLTGVRGLFAPFIGALLYHGWSLRLPGLDLSWRGIGAWSLILCGLISLWSVWLFVRLDRDIRAVTSRRPSRD